MAPTRLPKTSYAGRNGFSEIIDPWSIEAKHNLAKVHRRRLAQHVLDERGYNFPTLQDMAAANSQAEDTLPLVQERIRDIEKHHTGELDRLYTRQAQEYHDDAFSRFLSKDDVIQGLGQIETNPSDKKAFSALDKFHRDRKYALQEAEWDDALARIRRAHLQTTLPLHRQRAHLRAAEEERRKRLDARFPKSITEYYDIWNKDVQLRIARFLLADRVRQETMMSEFGWAWRQVEPLLGEMQKNVSTVCDSCPNPRDSDKLARLYSRPRWRPK
ncbi:hypothetical protein PLICRDRAFT_112494 [Plicaturopsis crispa FD-325 SS-3]|nr:hypothetical protein PLICRDRAFT_112494 [Plicaturopsis crispa FD-325 SS-3]